MDNKIYLSLPDFWANFDLNSYILTIYNDPYMKYLFNEDVVIDNIYGSFPCIWNGGRQASETVPYAPGLQIKRILQTFKDYGVKIRFTFTNSLIKEQHLNDTMGNNILKICKDVFKNIEGNSVNVSTPIMMNYIKQNYPEFYGIWSTTLCLKDIDKINELSKDNLLVLDYTLNNNFEILNKLEHPENIEILCTENCVSNCPYRKQHYDSISRFNMGEIEPVFVCKNNIDLAEKSIHNVNIEDFRKNYLPLGINKIKISGRGDPLTIVVDRYVDFLFKKEYKDLARKHILLNIIPPR